MEIIIKHNQNGAFKLIAEIRVGEDNNDNARAVLDNLLKSISTDLQILRFMERDPEATHRTYQVTPRPRVMSFD